MLTRATLKNKKERQIEVQRLTVELSLSEQKQEQDEAWMFEEVKMLRAAKY